jgi:acetyl-CoA C-acetyltransferase
MSKYATGIYSTEPSDWSAIDRFEKLPEADNAVTVSSAPFEAATVETYTINNTKTGSVAVFLGRNDAGERVSGNADLADHATRAVFESGDPFGVKLAVSRDESGRNIGRIA